MISNKLGALGSVRSNRDNFHQEAGNGQNWKCDIYQSSANYLKETDVVSWFYLMKYSISVMFTDFCPF